MGIALRALAIFIEIIILITMFYFILNGVRLILLDMGITQKYSKVISMILIAIGFILATFFISHLTAFYPPVGGGYSDDSCYIRGIYWIQESCSGQFRRFIYGAFFCLLS